MPTKPLDKIVYSEQEISNQSFDTEFGINVVEAMEFDGANLQRAPSGNTELLIDYNGGTNPVYLGKGPPGSATSSSVWLIKKLTFDGNNNVTAMQLANGSANFNQVWDNRASLSYS